MKFFSKTGNKINSEQNSPDSVKTIWNDIQENLADLAGEEGIIRRQKEYPVYFLGFGKDVIIHPGCRFYQPDKIVIADNVKINIGALIYGSGGVHLGRNVLIGPNLFLHSANHDVSPGETAFFERGYDYDSVEIGDNSLISANVNIMPGVKLKNGTFVAAAALVVKGEYRDDAQLKGIPARDSHTPLHTDDVLNSVFVLLVPNKVHSEGAHYESMARSLVESLRLPQFTVLTENEELNGCQHLLIFGPVDWIPEIKQSSDGPVIQIWSMSDADREHQGSIDICCFDKNLHLAKQLIHQWVPLPGNKFSDIERLANVSTYYATKRLRKLDDKFSLIWVEWLFLLNLVGESDAGLLVRDELTKRKEGLSHEFNDIKFDSINDDSEMFSLLSRLINRKQPLTTKILLNNPHLALLESLSSSGSDVESFLSSLEQAILASTKAHQLAIYGFCTHLLGSTRLLQLTLERLEKDFFDEESGYLHSAIGLSSYCYEPLLAAFLVIIAKKKNEKFVPEITVVETKNLSWQFFQEEDSKFDLSNVVNQQKKLISRSLLDNWLTTFLPPVAPDNTQFELTKSNYNELLHNIETVWFSVFRLIFQQSGISLVQVSPWPYPYTAALSIRYDVDRPLNSKQVGNAIDIQRKYLNSACSSWYFFPSNEQETALQRRLKNHQQELGIHALYAGTSGISGLGVTCHSGLGSEYWRGKISLQNYAYNDVQYAELLSSQITIPRTFPDAGDFLKKLWVLPIHFPLEAGINNLDLEYFDRLLNEFRKLRASGGHLILASHPDVDQSHLVELVKREHLNSLWCNTIERVIQRCRMTIAYDALQVAQIDTNKITLLSNCTIADLQVTVFSAQGDVIQLGPIQLNAGMPRIVGFLDLTE